MSASISIQDISVVHQHLQAGFVSEHPCYVWVGRSIYKRAIVVLSTSCCPRLVSMTLSTLNGTLLEWKRTSRFLSKSHQLCSLQSWQIYPMYS